MCRRILSTGLIICCTVYYNLHRYRRISFWQNLFALYIYFEKDVLLEDLLTEGYHLGRSTDSIKSFWKINLQKNFLLTGYPCGRASDRRISLRKFHWQKEFLLSVDSFSENLMKEENFHFNLPEGYPSGRSTDRRNSSCQSIPSLII